MKLPRWLVKPMGDYLIKRARRTPYSHLPDYMERYWLVPYVRPEGGVGCGPVSFWKRPIAWAFQRFGIAVRVHHILSSDKDRHLHDHPWPYLTVILRHGYIEYCPVSSKWCTVGDVMLRKAQSRHRLTVWSNQEPWTLFITGKYEQVWGFYTPEGKVPHHEYEASKTATISKSDKFFGQHQRSMILCPECGNKRCPKATDINLKCTGSNEPGQAGSSFERNPF